MGKKTTLVGIGFLFLLVAEAGMYIPQLLDSSGLEQSTTVKWDQMMRTAFAVSIIAAMVSIATLLYQRKYSGTPNSLRVSANRPQRKRGQFGLLSIFFLVTWLAVMLAVATASRDQVTFNPKLVCLFFVSFGLIMGPATHLVRDDLFHDRADHCTNPLPLQWNWRLALYFSLLVIAGLLDWAMQGRGYCLALVWWLAFLSIVWNSNWLFRTRMACFLAAIFLPYSWIVTESLRSSRGLEFAGILPVVPGVVPSVFLMRPDESLLVATIFTILMSLFGCWAAQCSRKAISWWSGFACAAHMFASFLLNAAFRA